MTVPERIVEFLNNSKGKSFCDDCLRDLLALARRQQAQQTTKPLGATAGYVRISARCSNCGDTKMVTASK